MKIAFIELTGQDVKKTYIKTMQMGAELVIMFFQKEIISLNLEALILINLNDIRDQLSTYRHGDIYFGVIREDMWVKDRNYTLFDAINPKFKFLIILPCVEVEDKNEPKDFLPLADLLQTTIITFDDYYITKNLIKKEFTDIIDL